MASIFPPSPQIGDVFTSNNTTWQWNGEAWIVVPTEGLSFKNITTTPNTQTVVADSGTDTLNLIAGENVSITAASAFDSITISSTGTYTSVDSVQYPDYIAFDTSPESTSASVGTISWDSGEGGLSAQLNQNINVTLGQEIIILATNGEATTLNKGEVVRLSGAQGQRPKVMRAYNTGDAGSALTIGIVAESIASGAEGYVVTQGIVKNINTNSFNEGDILYLSASAGVLTTVKPQAPNHYVFVGVVIKKNASSGRLYVKPQNGYELDELHDVRITSASAGDVIIWNSASSIWINESLQDNINSEVSNLFIHENHQNITASYNAGSTQILLASQGNIENAVFSHTVPLSPGEPGDLVYVINSASTTLLGIYEYVLGEWYNVISDSNLWQYLLDNDWQYVIDESGVAGWQHLLGGELFVASSSATYNSQYLPNLVAEILYLTKSSASSTYYPISGGTITGHVQINGNTNLLGDFTLSSASPAVIVNRSASPDVSIRWNESLDVWEFTNDGSEYNALGSGGGALIYQPEQPDTTDLEVGTVWIDSDQQVGSGLDIASFRVWNKTLAASATTLSGLDDDGNSLLYVQDLETVYLNGTLLIRDQDYTATSGSSVVLTEAAISGDVVTVHALEDILFADTYRRSEVDTLLDNIDALPAQSGNSGKFLTTDGTTADWASIVTGSASFFRWRKTYAASATLISGADDNAINLEYTPGLEQVYINGVMIATNEYTATSGSTIVLNDAVSASDVVDIFGYTSVNTTSTYSQAQIDAKYNNLVRWKKAYSASATVISGLDDNSVSLSYTPNYEQVYLNGILLTPITDYARTSASVITLGQAVISGDIIEVIGYAPFNVAEEVLPYSTSTPASPIAGSVWVDSTNPASPLLKVYNGSTWVSVSGGDSGLHPFFTAGI